MNLAIFYSFAIHFLLFCLLLLAFASKPIPQKNRATYTIDFIGQTDEVLRYGAPQQKAGNPKAEEQKQETPAEEPKQETKTEVKEEIKQETKTETKTEIKAETKTDTKAKTKGQDKAYNSKTQISTKPKKTQEKKKKVVLSKPSVLEQVETDNLDVSALHSLTTAGQGGAEKTVQASFTNFPYPWYITQVRNALWEAWQKYKPKSGSGLSALVTFTIDKNGAIYDTQLERTSGNEAYDYAALNAARDSAPYPALPKDFDREILTVTVEFKQEV